VIILYLGKNIKNKTMSDYTPFKMKGFSGFGNDKNKKQTLNVKKGSAADKKTYPKSYTKKDVEFLKKQREDVVRYEDLDKKGQEIWKSQGKKVPSKPSPAKSHKKGHKDQQGPIPEQNEPLRKSEMKGTWVYPGKGTKDPFVTSERMGDYEDRAEFARSDAEESTGKKKKEHEKTAKHLEREADIIRDRTRKTSTVDASGRKKKRPPYKQ